jgi:two-component system OmpR family response regulator
MAETLNVLCIDDDEDALIIAGISLGLDREISARTARGGSDALAILRQPDTRVDCILLDVRMPDISGPDLLTVIRTLGGHARTPVIFLTASVREVDAKHYAALGAIGMIAKPFDPLALAAQVRRLVAKTSPTSPADAVTASSGSR